MVVLSLIHRLLDSDGSQKRFLTTYHIQHSKRNRGPNKFFSSFNGTNFIKLKTLTPSQTVY